MKRSPTNTGGLGLRTGATPIRMLQKPLDRMEKLRYEQCFRFGERVKGRRIVRYNLDRYR